MSSDNLRVQATSRIQDHEQLDVRPKILLILLVELNCRGKLRTLRLSDRDSKGAG
jgi:hypothetical protein